MNMGPGYAEATREQAPRVFTQLRRLECLEHGLRVEPFPMVGRCQAPPALLASDNAGGIKAGSQ